MSAYKQLLTSDVIVSPFEVHKGFTFTNTTTSSIVQTQGGGKATIPGPSYFGGPSYPGVGINRFLGRNIDYFLFDPDIDPITGNYLVTTAGSIATYNYLSITPFHTEASTIGSSSFVVNGTTITLTGSAGGINQPSVIYVPTGSNDSNSTINIVNHINASSSFYFYLNNIAAAQTILPGPVAIAGITFASKTRGYINNFYYITSGSTTSYFSSGSNDTTTGEEYQRLIYNSVKELYYSNYLHCQYGDPDNPQVLIPGADSEGDRYIGSASSQAHYYNYLQSDLSYPRFFPTASDARIGVLSIPNTLFGDYIQPGSVKITLPIGSTTYEFYDDAEGNLRLSNSLFGTSSAIVGNVIYPHGMVILTGNSTLYNYMNSALNGSLLFSPYAVSIYGQPPVPTYVYGTYTDLNNIITNFVSSSNITCSFSSSYTIYETQYKCTIRENEYNYTLNPSTFTSTSSSIVSNDLNVGPCNLTTITSSTGLVTIDGIPYDYVNQDYFSPYITTIGLYDEQQNLLAIGKLSQPLPSSPTTDTTIIINIDR